MWRRRTRSSAPVPEPEPEVLDWAWAVKEGKGAPDEGFRARVRPGDADRLAELVTSTPLDGFVLDDVFPPAPQADGVMLHYVDESTYARLLEQKASGSRKNIYISDVIAVEGNVLKIFRGYGGRGDRCLATETDLLVRLACCEDVVVEEWLVREEDYDVRTFAEGHSGAELLEYLGCRQDS